MNAANQFETDLRIALSENPTEKRRARAILKLLDAPPSRQRTKRLARMERTARAAVGDGVKIDWE
ncbi:MAG: hypothetical protein H7210_01110, partial [Pyrinomonadaceae bacterium]|nr:hypothetical protein [Phycisphaerales bacterium]